MAVVEIQREVDNARNGKELHSDENFEKDLFDEIMIILINIVKLTSDFLFYYEIELWLFDK